MSASEKLRALDVDLEIFDAGPHWVALDGPSAGDAVCRLKSSLPLIADVVEAAETILNVNELYSESEAYKRIEELGRPALTALREHLEAQ